MVYVRRDAWSLQQPWDDVFLWYARAITKLKKLPESNPTSWSYQASIHGHEPESQRSQYWNQCQHGTSFFLPWHRGYLGWFEQIVRATIKELEGPEDWALPYWNYSSPVNPNALVIPQAFREPNLPDGSENPLLIEGRNPGVNAGEPVADEEEVSVAALDVTPFEGVGRGGSTGFGGPAVGFHHEPGSPGAVEATPHNSIHVAVGGLMAAFSTAPLDPIFWLHHANIDRLWEIWRKKAGHVDPTGSWLSFPFDIHDAQSNPIKFTPQEMLPTKSAPLTYEYDSLTDPREEVPPSEGGPAPSPAGQEPEAIMAEQTPSASVGPPEMVGATEGGLDLSAHDPSTATLAVSEPQSPGIQALIADPNVPDPHVYLNVENVTSESPSRSYGVYLNVPSGQSPAEHPELLAGVLAPFGSERAERPDDEHGGLHFTFDITKLVDAERAQGNWNPEAVQVTFQPRGRSREPSPLKVGRVSIYYHR